MNQEDTPKTFEISIEDVEIVNNDIEGWLVASDNGVTVALDTTLTDDLIQEGIAREFVSRIQNLRKDSGFEVIDRIIIELEANENIQTAIKAKNNYICNETLCDKINFSNLSNKNEIDFLEGKIKVAVKKV
jgi:isoleucyl-tRNA synthetase